MGNVASYSATARLDAPENVLPGMAATVTIADEEALGVTTLEMAALSFHEDGTPYVLIRQGDGSYQEREVETGLSDGMRVEIVSGVEPGETVWAVAGTEAAEDFSLGKLYASLVGQTVVIQEGERSRDTNRSFSQDWTLPEGMEVPEGGQMPEGMEVPEGGQMPEGWKSLKAVRCPRAWKSLKAARCRKAWRLPRAARCPKVWRLPRAARRPKTGQPPQARPHPRTWKMRKAPGTAPAQKGPRTSGNPEPASKAAAPPARIPRTRRWTVPRSPRSNRRK